MSQIRGGKIPGRRCTDSGWILNLILVWTLVAVIAVASVGLLPSNFIQAGSKLRLYGLMDYRGNFCGVSEEVKTLPFLWRPNEGGTNYNNRLDFVPQKFGICIESCPKFDESRMDPYTDEGLGSWRSEQATIDVAGVCQDVHSRLPGDIWRSIWVDIDLVWEAIVLGSTALPLVLCALLAATYLSCFGHSSNCMNLVIRGLMWHVCVVLVGGGAICIYNSYRPDMTIFGDGTSAGFDPVTHKNNHVPKSQVEVELQRATGAGMLGAAVLWMLMMSTVSAKRVATALDLLYSLILLVRAQPVLLFPPLLGLYLLIELVYYTYFFGIHIASSSSVAAAPIFPNATMTTPVGGNANTTAGDRSAEYQYIVYNEHIEPYLYMLFALFCWSGWIVNALTQLVMSNLVWRWYGLIEARATGSELDTDSEISTGGSDEVSELSDDDGGDRVEAGGAGMGAGPGTSNIGVWDVYKSYVLVMSNHIGTAACGSIYIHALFPLRLLLRPLLRVYLWLCLPPRRSDDRVPLRLKDENEEEDEPEAEPVAPPRENCIVAVCRRLVCCCCGCSAMTRLFRVLRIQNNNAYVICAYKGHDFKKSSVHAEKLLKKFMNKGKYILNNLQLVLFIVSGAICLSCALVAYICLAYAELQTLHEFIAIPWIIATIAFFVINLWFQTIYILLATLMIAYIVDEQVDFGRGARRLPVLHLMFVQLYNHRYEQVEGDSDDPAVPEMEDMGRHSGDEGAGGTPLARARRLGMRGLLVEEEDSDSDREMESLVGEDSFGSGDRELIAEYIGVQDQDNALFVYTPMSSSDKEAHAPTGGGVAEGLSSLSAMSVQTLQSLGAGRAPTANMMKMFNRSHGISAEQANAYMPTDIESVASDHSGFEMSMRSTASNSNDGGAPGRGSMLFKLQSIPEISSRSDSMRSSSNSSVASSKSKSMAYV
mgnify:FL=1